MKKIVCIVLAMLLLVSCGKDNISSITTDLPASSDVTEPLESSVDVSAVSTTSSAIASQVESHIESNEPTTLNYWHFNYGSQIDNKRLEPGDVFHGLTVEDIKVKATQNDAGEYFSHSIEARFSGTITLTGKLTIDPDASDLVYYYQLFFIDEPSQEYLPWASDSLSPPTMMSFDASLDELYDLTGYKECTDIPCRITLSDFTYFEFPSELVSWGTLVSFKKINVG